MASQTQVPDLVSQYEAQQQKSAPGVPDLVSQYEAESRSSNPPGYTPSPPSLHTASSSVSGEDEALAEVRRKNQVARQNISKYPEQDRPSWANDPNAPMPGKEALEDEVFQHRVAQNVAKEPDEVPGESNTPGDLLIQGAQASREAIARKGGEIGANILEGIVSQPAPETMGAIPADERVAPPVVKGVARGVGRTIGSVAADPFTWIAGGASSAAGKTGARLISGAFAADMGAGTYEQAKQLREIWSRPDVPSDAKAEATSSLIMQALMAGAATKHALTPHPVAAVPPPDEATQALINYEKATGNPQFQEAPKPAPQINLDPDHFKNISAVLANLPHADRQGVITKLHPQLAEQLLQTGSFLGPDGKLHVVKTPEEAGKLAQQFINDAVDSHDKRVADEQKVQAEAAKTAAKEPAPSQPSTAVRRFMERSRPAQKAAAETPVQKPVQNIPENIPADTATNSNERPAEYQEAVKLVTDFGKASTSLLQRRLRIGYSQASNLIELMEQDGIVSKADGAHPREVLHKPDIKDEATPPAENTAQTQPKHSFSDAPIYDQHYDGPVDIETIEDIKNDHRVPAETRAAAKAVYEATIDSGMPIDDAMRLNGTDELAKLLGGKFDSVINARVEPPDTKSLPPAENTAKQSEPAHKNASTQINIEPESDLGHAHAAAVSAIPDEHIGKEGRETTPHVTVRYGLQDDSPSAIAKIKQAASRIPPFEVPIGKTEVFPATEHSSYDHPVIARLETTPELKSLRKAVEGAGDFKEDNFPEYKPHVTLAYVKPEFAEQYKGGSQLEGQKVPVREITVSKKDGSQETIPLGDRRAKPRDPTSTSAVRLSQLRTELREAESKKDIVAQHEISQAIEREAAVAKGESFTPEERPAEGTAPVPLSSDLQELQSRLSAAKQKVAQSRSQEDYQAARKEQAEIEKQMQETAQAEKQPTKESSEYQAVAQRVAELENKHQPAKKTAIQALVESQGKKVAERFRSLADAMDAQIEDKRRAMTQNPTPKRMKEYRSRLHDADNMERVQTAMRTLADAHENGTVPRELAGLKSKDDIHRLVYKGIEPGGYYDLVPSQEYGNKSREGKMLQGMVEGYGKETSAEKAEKERQQKISQAEADVQFSNLPGYFPTPKATVERMVEMADIQPGMSVLEPSAGKGNIADAVKESVPDVDLSTIEQQNKLRNILELKGHKVADRDFLEHQGQYDRIVMNPPFEKGQDIEHVRHAYDLLKPGGKLVSVMSEGPFFRNDKKASEFRDWLEEHGGTSEKLPEGSFKESGTGVNARLVEMEKPEQEQTAAATPQWKYEEYSDWSRQLAKNYTVPELEKRLGKANGERAGAAASHLRAIERTHSMQSNSQARAQSGNVVRANYEERMAIENALELHRIYPEKTKSAKSELSEQETQFAKYKSQLMGASASELTPLWRGIVNDKSLPAYQADKLLTARQQREAQLIAVREPISTAKVNTEYQQHQRIAGQDGNESRLLTPSGEKPVRYRLVEASDLKTSHDPMNFNQASGYPEGVQERTYHSSKEAQSRVIQQAQNYEPAYTINNNPDAVNGPPVITPDGVVLGGNSRAMSTARLYRSGKGEIYRDALAKQAQQFGIDQEQIKNMREPVLVREITDTPKNIDEMRRLASDLNKPMTGALGVNERAVSAGKSVSQESLNRIGGMLQDLGEGSTLRDAMRENGKQMVAMMVRDGVITDRERPQFVDTSTGGLSDEGKTFVERALVGSVVDDPNLMDAVPKSVLNKLEGSLGDLASVGSRTDEYNLLPLLREALNAHAEMVRSGMTVDDYLGQQDMFGPPRNPAVDALIRALSSKPREFREAVRQFTSDANFDVHNQGTLGFGEQPSAPESFNAAFKAKLSPDEFRDALLQSIKGGSKIDEAYGQERGASPTTGGLQQDTPSATRPGGRAGVPEDAGRGSGHEPANPREDSVTKPFVSKKTAGPRSPEAGFSALDVPAALGRLLEPSRETTISRDTDDQFYTLGKQYEADVLRAIDLMKDVREHTSPEEQETIYHHKEDSALALTPEQQQTLDQVVQPIMDTNAAIRSKLNGAGVPVGENEGYVHRIVEGKSSQVERAVRGSKSTGKGNVLSTSASSLKGRTMFAVDPVIDPQQSLGKQGKAPESRVISIQNGRITSFEHGTPTDMGSSRGLRPGDSFTDKNGQDWAIRQATTKEIEEHTDLRYYKNALVSAVTDYLQLRRAERAYDALEAMKSNPEFQSMSFKSERGSMPPEDWRRAPAELPQFRDYYFEPHLADAMERFAKELRPNPEGALDKIGHLMTASLVLNPARHIFNIGNHWLVERGIAGTFNPLRWPTASQAGIRAIKAVFTQNHDFVEALDKGTPLMSHRQDMRELNQHIYESLVGQLEENADASSKLAKIAGYAHPVEMIKALWKMGQKATWMSNDVFFLQSVYEKQARGLSFDEAMKQTAKHIPDYRIPPRVLNSQGLAAFMGSPKLTVFSRYHYGVWKSYWEMVKEAAGPESSLKDRAHGIDHMLMLGFLTFVAYEAWDKVLKKLTGDQNARMVRSGASAMPYLINEVRKGNRAPEELLQGTFTPAVLPKTLAEIGFNRDLYSGGRIYDRHDTAPNIIADVGKKAVGALGPVQQAEKASRPGSGTRDFTWNLGGVTFPKSESRSRAENLMHDLLREKQMITPDRQREMEARRRQVDEGHKTYGQMQAEHKKQALGELRYYLSLRDFNYSDVKRVYEVATPEEKEVIKPIMRMKAMHLLQSNPWEAQREHVLDDIRGQQ